LLVTQRGLKIAETILTKAFSEPPHPTELRRVGTSFLDDVLEATDGNRIRGFSKLFSDLDEADDVAKAVKRLKQS
jgi:hypothetical protein